MAVQLNEFEMMEPGMSLSSVYGITDDGVIEDETLAPLECSLYTRLLRKEAALYKLTLTSQAGTEVLDVKDGDNLYDVIVKRALDNRSRREKDLRSVSGPTRGRRSSAAHAGRSRPASAEKCQVLN